MQPLSWHGSCLTCGTMEGDPEGVRYFVAEDGSALAEVALTERFEGAPGHAHGGSLAAIMDETMGWAVWLAGYRALAAKLEIDYRVPTPLHVPLVCKGRILGTGNRSIRTAAEIYLPDGRMSAEAKGIFVDLGDRWDEQFASWA
ncbi:MAG: PaaI family thioesterase, partial [Cyanobacteria bacterium REEB65]|nr:PaaI family thioesterase [Cyanobacteria bacterium REEB65]